TGARPGSPQRAGHRPAPAAPRGPGGARRGGTVRAWFRFGEVPGVTLGAGAGAGAGAIAGARTGAGQAPPPGAGARAARAAALALAEAGLGHLGGRLELRTYGPPPAAPRLARAARRAVARALAARPRP
ncbi:hypothetical protein ACFWBI_29580, partial [Streptomyces sp. NPDC059982]|uniref:hypothetical protein n=1 Tax=Streptomyces sp. NPDC059982 TaxID=3347024 RepID=UPI00369D7C28